MAVEEVASLGRLGAAQGGSTEDPPQDLKGYILLYLRITYIYIYMLYVYKRVCYSR